MNVQALPALCVGTTGPRLKTAAPFHMLRFRTPGHQEVSSSVAVSFDERILWGEFMGRVIASIAVLAAFIGNPALADETVKKEPTRIEIDQEAKAFIFIIDDKPVAMLDKDGLHVAGGIDYGLSLTDTGPDSVKKKIASITKGATDE